MYTNPGQSTPTMSQLSRLPLLISIPQPPVALVRSSLAAKLVAISYFYQQRFSGRAANRNVVRGITRHRWFRTMKYLGLGSDMRYWEKAGSHRSTHISGLTQTWSEPARGVHHLPTDGGVLRILHKVSARGLLVLWCSLSGLGKLTLLVGGDSRLHRIQ